MTPVKCCYAEGRYADCSYAEYCSTDCHYPECYSVNCRSADLLSVIMLWVVMPIVVVVSVIL